MAQGFSLADQLVNLDTVRMLASGFHDVFDPDDFALQAMAAVGDMALMGRLRHIAVLLQARLAPDFPTAAQQILQGMPPPLDPTLTDDDFGHFIYAPLGFFIENQALEDHFESGLDLLAEITKRFLMEYSIRPFLIKNPTAALARMRQWAQDDNYHVRRLASEGTRPRLPWGQAIGLSHSDTLPILDALHSDPTRFVTRSVSNHLNDITKTDPEPVLAQLQSWVDGGQQNAKELHWMRKHALRGLIKSGHAGAMDHLGYRRDVALSDCVIALPDQVKMGDKVAVNVSFTAIEDAPLIVDYIVHFQKANGKTSPKMFKLKVLDAKAGKRVNLTKQHHFKDTATTFRLFAGAHRVDLQINGRIVAGQDFALA